MEDLAETIGSANCLPTGTQVGEYRLLRVVGEGGFGVVYEARDLSLDRIVAVKEYMPSTLAGRTASNQLHVRSQHRGAFDAGLRSFINEARLLAKFSHPALVHVYRFFEANGTAYMVMRYYEGTTFKGFLAAQPGAPGEAWLSAMLAPVLDVLEMLHAADCYHRDISPDNIFLQASGGPVLLDFGAARRIIGDLTQALTMVLKPGFAPIEQYVDDGAMPQGAWTDIYQIGAMLFLAVTGRPPATAVARLINDPTPVLTPATYPAFGARFLQGIQRALAVKPEDRPQTIAALRDALGLAPTRAAALAVSSGHAAVALPVPLAALAPETVAPRPVAAAPAPAAAASVLAPVEPAARQVTALPSVAEAPESAPADQPRPASMPRMSGMRGLPLAGAGAAGLLMVAVLLAWWNRGGEPADAGAEAPVAAETAAPPAVSPSTGQRPAAPPPIATAEVRSAAAIVSAPTAVKASSPAPAPARPPTPAQMERLQSSPPAVDTAAQAERPAADTGTVVLRVAPWGQVSVNRVAKGTAPPLRVLQLPAGEHRIEITNPAAAPLVRMVQVKKGETVVLQHKFE